MFSIRQLMSDLSHRKGAAKRTKFDRNVILPPTFTPTLGLGFINVSVFLLRSF